MEKSFSERVAEARSAVASVSPQEAYLRKTENPDTVFIDPRSMEDIQKTTGIIPGALNVPLSALNEAAGDTLPRELSSRARPVIAACQGGPMGALAAHALKKRGFSDVAFIDVGTQGWLDAGYATLR